jgi:hypothetical protein
LFDKAVREHRLAAEIAEIESVLTFPNAVQRMLFRMPLLDDGLIEQPRVTGIV